MTYSTSIAAAIAEVPAGDWDALAGDPPFLRHGYFHALETTGCVGEDTGWIPRHLTLWQNDRLAAAMPLYEKTHSYGEYVFDWAWAQAYERSGLRYYPKLVSAIPFTPVQCQRLLARDGRSRDALLTAFLDLARASGRSSAHVLFPTLAEAALMQAHGMLLRHSVQFHWRNAGYADFEQFLASLTRDKRKKIRQERRRVHDAGVRFRHLVGEEIGDDQWRFFLRCYRRTYGLHASTPYLNLDFFLRLAAVMPENLVLVLGERDGHAIASALNVFTDRALYGRYWGALEFVPALHFETCYYQAIDFCIARGIDTFEGGAQGEHKLARGLLPVRTVSAHWLAHPEFTQALERYLARESASVAEYIDKLSGRGPFREP